MGFTITALNFMTLGPFERMVPEAWAPDVEGLGTDPRRLAFGAHDDDGPTGIGLLDLSAADGAWLSWLFVREAKRRRGAGAALLAAAETAAVEMGCRSMRARVPVGDVYAAFSAMLERAGFSFAQGVLRSYAFDSAAHDDPWFARARLPPDVELFPWAERTAAERERIAAAEVSLAPFARPSQFDGDFDGETSLGVRHGGEVAAWLITRQPQPKALSFVALYVTEGLRRHGVAVALAADALRRQVALRGRDFEALVTIASFNDGMAGMLERLSPYVRGVREMRVADKALTPSS